MIYLTQWRCEPHRHLVTYIVWDEDATNPQAVVESLRSHLLRSGRLLACCLCGATAMHVTHHPTGRADMAAAAEDVAALETHYLSLLEMATSARQRQN